MSVCVYIYILLSSLALNLFPFESQIAQRLVEPRMLIEFWPYSLIYLTASSLSGPHNGPRPVQCITGPFKHLWFQDLDQGYPGSALKVLSHLSHPPGHLPCFVWTGARNENPVLPNRLSYHPPLWGLPLFWLWHLDEHATVITAKSSH